MYDSVGKPEGHYPRVSRIDRANGSVTSVERVPKHRAAQLLKLRIGDTCHRTLQDDDMVLLNRQPSLHRCSIMAHKARIDTSGADCIRLPISDTSPYNADFDGDEMNVHALQTITSCAEAKTLMSIEACVLNDAGGGLMIGPVQDMTLALYYLSNPDTKFDHQEMCQLWMQIKYKHSAFPEPQADGMWRGVDLISCMLPKWFSYRRCGVVVTNGVFQSGILTSKTVGKGPKSMCTAMALQCARTYTEFLSDVQRVGCTFLREYFGATVTINNCKPDEAILEKAKEMVAAASTAVSQATKECPNLSEAAACFAMNRLLPLMNDLTKERMEKESENHFFSMVSSGSKGKTMNGTQVSIMVGQQSVHGQRIAPPPGHNRCLPHFDFDDVSPESRGLVKSSFYSGLSPTEMYAHMMSSREGLFNSACLTADSGYLYRKARCAVEGAIIQNNGELQDGDSRTLMSIYGGDGYSPSRLVPCAAPWHDIEQTRRQLRLLHLRDAEFALSMLAKASEVAKLLFGPFQHANTIDGGNLRLPFDPSSILSSNNIHVKPTSRTKCCKMSGLARSLMCDDEIPITVRLAFALIPSASTSIIALPETWDAVALAARELIEKAVATPLTPAGVLAASSLGETISQMTLNSFHSAGVYSEEISLGLPYFTYLLSASKSGKNAQMRVLTKGGPEVALKLARKLKLFVLGDVVTSVAVLTEDSGLDAELDAALLPPDILNSPIINIIIDKGKILRNDIDMSTVLQKVANHLGDLAHVSCNSVYNARELLLRIRPIMKKDEETSTLSVRQHCEGLAGEILGVRVSGMAKLKSGNVDVGANGQRYVTFLGSDLRFILSHPDVEYASSTDVYETSQVLGIEASRHALMRELMRVSGSNTSAKHASVLACYMTRTGRLEGATRHGFKRSGLSSLRRMGFETMMSETYNAAALGETTTTASSSITDAMTVGMTPQIGSGAVCIVHPKNDKQKQIKNKMRILSSDRISHFVGIRRKLRTSRFLWDPSLDLPESFKTLCLQQHHTASESSMYMPESPTYETYDLSMKMAVDDSYRPVSPSNSATYAPVSPCEVAYMPISPK